jgi:hypothetical protein
MNTFWDLLILVVLALAAVSLVAMVLQFLVKNRTVKRFSCTPLPSWASTWAMWVCSFCGPASRDNVALLFWQQW